MNVEWVQGQDVFGAYRSRWDDLFASASNATPFQSHSWLEAWHQTFAPTHIPLALAVKEGKDLLAWWPFIQTRGLCRALRPMGAGISDYLHPLIRTNATTEIQAALEQAPHCDLIDLPEQRQDLSPIQRPDGLKGNGCLVLDLPATWGDYTKTLSKSLRYDLKPKNTQIQPGDLQTLFDLHKKRWNRRGLPGSFPAKVQAFHHLLLAKNPNLAQVHTLKTEEGVIGAIYTLRAGQTTFFYQSGIAPAQSNISPGTLLVGHAIQKAIEEGQIQFDFLRGSEPYKRRWKPQHEHFTLRYMWSRTTQGALPVHWKRPAHRIQQAVISQFEGKSLLPTRRHK